MGNASHHQPLSALGLSYVLEASGRVKSYHLKDRQSVTTVPPDTALPQQLAQHHCTRTGLSLPLGGRRTHPPYTRSAPPLPVGASPWRTLTDTHPRSTMNVR